MTKITESTLRRMVREEASKLLKEEEGPIASESKTITNILKAFEDATGIKPGKQLSAKKGRQEGVQIFEYDLNDQLDSPIEKALFKTMVLRCTTFTKDGSISIDFELMYTHVDRGSNGKSIGRMMYDISTKQGRYGAYK